MSTLLLTLTTQVAPTGLAQTCPPGLIYGTDGSGGNPSTLYSFDPVTGSKVTIGPIGFDRVGAIDFSQDGVLYGTALRPGTFPATLGQEVFIVINTLTGAGTEVGSTGGVDDFEASFDLSFRPSDGFLFATGKRDPQNFDEDALGTVDPVTGLTTEIGATPVGDRGNGVAFSGEDDLFYATGATLHTLNPTSVASESTKALTFTGDLAGARINAMDFDPVTGALYASVNGTASGTRYLAIVDTDSGIVTEVTPWVARLDGIAVQDPQVSIVLEKSKVHFHGNGKDYVDFKGTLTLLQGNLPSDLRSSDTEAAGKLSVKFNGSATPAYLNEAILFEVKGVNANDNKEKWEFKNGKEEKIVYQMKEHVEYKANEDPNVAALGLGKLDSEFIHSEQTELRFDYKNVARPATLLRNGFVLVIIDAAGTVTEGPGVDADPRGSSKVDILLSGGPEAKLVPGDIIQWVTPSVTYSHVINGQNAATTYFSAGGKFDIRVPITGVNFGDLPRTVVVQMEIGNGTTLVRGNACFEVTEADPYELDGNKHWKFHEEDDED